MCVCLVVCLIVSVSRLHLESFPGASLDQSQRRRLLAVTNGTLEINCTEPGIHTHTHAHAHTHIVDQDIYTYRPTYIYILDI